MEGEDERSEDVHSFSKASIPKRIAICAAGALVNIIFAIIVYFIVIATSGVYISNVVDSIIPEYAAEQVGIQSGDKIIGINGKIVDNMYDLDDIMEKATGEELLFRGDSHGEALEFIIKINGEETNGDTNKIIEVLQQEGLETIDLTLKRGNAEINLEFTPDTVSSYYLGVNMKLAPDTFLNRCFYGLIETKEFVFSIIDNVKQLFTGNVGIDQMTGPIGIGEMVSKTNGVKEFVYLMALISISLGVTNLLPIPALDGGKILILIIEAIRKKPMKPENEINIQLLGFSILIALSIYVSYNDILRLF